MLAVRIVGDEEEACLGDCTCSLCGKETDDVLITPWDHIEICKECQMMAVYFFQGVRFVWQGIVSKDGEYLAWCQGLRERHATSS